MKTLLILVNVDWFLISHRLVIARAAAKAGWNVYVACEDTGRSNEIESEGVKFINVEISRSGTNPFKELDTLFKFNSIYKMVKPDVVHHVTLKPVVYGSLLAKYYKTKGVVNAISGLGYTFTEGRVGIVQKLILRLMKYSFNRKNLSVIFQNNDDKMLFEQMQILNTRNSTYLIKGSGIDLDEFSFKELPDFKRVSILFPARMLWDKGIKELREATDYLKEKYSQKIQFILAGMEDNENKSGVSASYLEEWQDGDYVKWIGHQSNMARLYEECHLVVLPSYREGLPKSLIEACAIGRAIITTNAIGCKDCVDEGVNGFKVPVKDGGALALAIEELVNDKKLMERMGKEGRTKAEREFDLNDVVRRHLEIYESVIER